jgi:hypothetical protein
VVCGGRPEFLPSGKGGGGGVLRGAARVYEKEQKRTRRGARGLYKEGACRDQTEIPDSRGNRVPFWFQ